MDQQAKTLPKYLNTETEQALIPAEVVSSQSGRSGTVVKGTVE